MLRIRIIAVCVCLGMAAGLAPQLSWAASPYSGKAHSGKDLLSLFRTSKSPVAKAEAATDAASAASYYRMAKHHAAQNDISRANTHFSLALQNAASGQVLAIATDYATFLSETGDLTRAELMLRQALSQSPNNTELTKLLARCLVRQNKVIEGRRHLLAVGTEAEASREIAAIYREQGNTEMLVAVEMKWGTTSPERVSPKVPITEPLRSEPSLIAATSVVSPMSKSEFFDNRVPIPVPKITPQPPVLITVNETPRSIPAPPRLPAPVHTPAPLSVEDLVITNPVKLVAAPLPTAPMRELNEPSVRESSESSKPIVMFKPRRHYVVNAENVSNSGVPPLTSIKPASATMPQFSWANKNGQ